MNNFIELRKSFFEKDKKDSFAGFFIEEYVENNEFEDLEEYFLLSKVAKIKRLFVRDEVEEDKIVEFLFDLGRNDYLDRYIVDITIKNCHIFYQKKLKIILFYLMIEKECNDSRLYNLLDICIECNIDALDEDNLSIILKKYQRDFSMLAMIIDYIHYFKKKSCTNFLYSVFDDEYPENIKMQILNVFADLYSIDKLDNSFIQETIKHEKNQRIYKDYIKFLKKEVSLNGEGLTLVQSMFYGDCESSGKGKSGGLCVLLKSLGNQLAKHSEVSMIITLTISNDWTEGKSLIHHYSDKHWFVRLPIYLDLSEDDMFLKRQLFIKRSIKRFIERSNAQPDIFHIRYLDNASKSVALLSKELEKKLVFTLTPDPHRNMSDSNGNLRDYSVMEILEKLDKISIGDELLTKGDGILGIGNEKVRSELEMYFPQLLKESRDIKLEMVAEGIENTNTIEDFDLEKICKEKSLLHNIDDKFFEKPIMLNVGRLNILKGQDQLLKAWGESRLSCDYNLLLIGGDLEKPNEEEQTMIEFFSDYIKQNSHLKSRFCHIGALSNESIRNIERKIMETQLELPHMYVCSSKKEEFGISILEALSEKLLIFAPKKGGVQTYIQNGLNGFLIDTTDWESISTEIERIMYDLKIDKDEFKHIQLRGQETVENNYSLEKISNDFLSFYLSFKRRETIAI